MIIRWRVKPENKKFLLSLLTKLCLPKADKLPTKAGVLRKPIRGSRLGAQATKDPKGGWSPSTETARVGGVNRFK